MIDVLAPLSIRIFTCFGVLRTSFYKTFILFESFLRILSVRLNSPKVMGTKSSYVEDLKLFIVFIRV